MPAITKVVPSRDHAGANFLDTVKVQQTGDSAREEEKEEFEDFEEYTDDDSEMEGSILQRPRPKKALNGPSLPRNEKRAPTVLENVRIELHSLDGTTAKDADKISIIQESDPHELYLSSEEDASLSDDYEDSFLDFEEGSEDMGEGSQPVSRTSSRRKSQEDTARIVSFVVVKPQIVNISIPSNHSSPTNAGPQLRHSVAFESLSSLRNSTPTPSPPKHTLRRPSPLTLYANADRRMSISSMATMLPSQHNSPYTYQNCSMSNLSSTLTTPTARKPSRLGITSNLSSFKSSLSHASHSFLSSDPFAQSPILREEPSESNPAIPEPPKTPTSLGNWKRGFQRSLGKARKQSMPKIGLAYASGNTGQQQKDAAKEKERQRRVNSVSVSMIRPSTGSRASSYSSAASERAIRRSETEPVTPTMQSKMFELARTPPMPPLPAEKSEKKRSFGGLGRRMSVRGREGRWT